MKKTIIMLLVPLLGISQPKLTIKTSIPVIVQGKTFNLDGNKQDSILTTNKAIYKNQTYSVYAIKKTGRLFISTFSKNGKYYRKYINNETN
jgi:hypothetical protein